MDPESESFRGQGMRNHRCKKSDVGFCDDALQNGTEVRRPGLFHEVYARFLCFHPKEGLYCRSYRANRMTVSARDSPKNTVRTVVSDSHPAAALLNHHYCAIDPGRRSQTRLSTRLSVIGVPLSDPSAKARTCWMTAVLLFIFMLVTCLMFLGMLWGDRLSFPGLFEGNWLNPIGKLIELIARTFGEALDVTVEFIVAHLSWVVTAVSGTAGLILVGFLMGGGLAHDAEVYHRDSVAALDAGGVVDQIGRVKPAEPAQEIASGIMLAKADVDDSHFVDQAKGGGYLVFERPEYQIPRIRTRRPIDGSIAAAPTDRPLLERADLDVRFERLPSETANRDDGQIVRTEGRRMNDLPDVQFVDRAVRRLLRDNWQAGVSRPNGFDRTDRLDEEVPESPVTAVRNLESRIRVTPGVQVSSQDLRIEKSAPQRSATGEVTIQLMITNLAEDNIDGLLVRELLPYGTRVRGTAPEGILHDATLTWLINSLRPQEERVLRFTVIPVPDPKARRDTIFETQTEVSALTAVTTRTIVTEDRIPTRPRTRDLPPVVARAPRLRLEIADPETAVTVGNWTTVLFRITNIGNANADGVRLRLTLDEMLDHHALNDDDLEREVVAPIARIAPDGHLDFELVVKPRRTGTAESTAELLFEGEQIELRRFRFPVGADRSAPTTSPRVRP